MINWHPHDRQVRIFGLASLVALPVATAIWTRGSLGPIAAAAALGGLIVLLGLAWPRGLRPVLVAINVVTAPLVLLIHDLSLSVAFFLVIVPVGMVLRLCGRDALHLKIDRTAASYWQPKKQPGGARSYFRRW
jgi:hypothetical protein